MWKILLCTRLEFSDAEAEPAEAGELREDELSRRWRAASDMGKI